MAVNEEKINQNQEENDIEPIIVLGDDLIDEKERLNKQLIEDLRSLKAEFSNYRRRSDESVKAARTEGYKEIIEKLLPVMDAFENARKLIKDKNVLEGIELIFAQIDNVLTQYGVEKINALGEEFNPLYHNAVMTKQDKQNCGKVIEVLKSGYTINGKVLRYAYVTVAE